ncbi:hypothetical protein [Pantoea agglomerans]|uniref:hypothetical protein n=1 Tax=Enterobacter agglomerans TaxID=549 RepID=UPI00278027AC|nr:hypothetical protein [Pantoea agglomerans]MDQ0435618.1 putative transcriptional regulator [Pantoea agglomerans]
MPNHSKSSRVKAVRLPNEVMDHVDDIVKARKIDHSAFIKAAIMEKLQREGYKLQA